MCTIVLAKSFALFLAKKFAPQFLLSWMALSSHFPLPKTLHFSKQFAFFALSNGVIDRGSKQQSKRSNFRLHRSSFLSKKSKKWIKLIPKTIGNRKRDCAWGCAWGINTTWENLQIEKHKSGRRSFRSPNWFVLFDLQIFSGGVYSPSATSRTISFSISNSFWDWSFYTVSCVIAKQSNNLSVGFFSQNLSQISAPPPVGKKEAKATGAVSPAPPQHCQVDILVVEFVLSDDIFVVCNSSELCQCAEKCLKYNLGEAIRRTSEIPGFRRNSKRRRSWKGVFSLLLSTFGELSMNGTFLTYAWLSNWNTFELPNQFFLTPCSSFMYSFPQVAPIEYEKNSRLLLCIHAETSINDVWVLAEIF